MPYGDLESTYKMDILEGNSMTKGSRFLIPVQTFLTRIKLENPYQQTES